MSVRVTPGTRLSCFNSQSPASVCAFKKLSVPPFNQHYKDGNDDSGCLFNVFGKNK